jgi:hypothetical protein
VKLHWESEDRLEWAHVAHGHSLHVLRSEGRWNWYAIGETGSCDDPDSAREAAEQAAVKYVTELAKSLGLTVLEVP